MNQSAITVDNVWKRYRKGQTGYHTLREDLYNLTGRLLDFGGEKRRNRDAEHIWALREVSFEVKPGERVGIIGRNGSGKTTLLRMLAGITRPNQGVIEVRGRLGVLIEIMAGFHPELTGRENVYLNGAIMGMSKKEIKRKFDEIVAFSELEEFIDTPIKRYSSGMHVRLGFAVAAHLDPDILLIDEVLAVGDAQFQQKCLGKMEGAAQEGRTVVFVSHNMAAVRRLCERGIVLSSGSEIFDGASSDAVDAYMSAVPSAGKRTVVFEDDPSKPIVIKRVSVLSPGKDDTQKLDINDPLVIELEYTVRQDMRGASITLALSRDGVVLFRSWDTDKRQDLLNARRAGDYVARIPMPRGLLAPGLYSIFAGAGRSGVGPIIQHSDCLAFELECFRQDLSHASHSRGGALIMELEWDLTPGLTTSNEDHTEFQ